MYQGYKELKTAEDGSASKESITPTKLYHFCSAAIKGKIKVVLMGPGGCWMFPSEVKFNLFEK